MLKRTTSQEIMSAAREGGFDTEHVLGSIKRTRGIGPVHVIDIGNRIFVRDLDDTLREVIRGRKAVRPSGGYEIGGTRPVYGCEECGDDATEDYWSATDCNETGKNVVLCEYCARGLIDHGLAE